MNCQIVGRPALADQLDDRALPVFGHALALEQLHHRAVARGLSACDSRGRLEQNATRSSQRRQRVPLLMNAQRTTDHRVGLEKRGFEEAEFRPNAIAVMIESSRCSRT